MEVKQPGVALGQSVIQVSLLCFDILSIAICIQNIMYFIDIPFLC